MAPSPEDYESVARRLDGERVELTDAQQALAGEISANAAGLAPALDVPLPAGLLHRVQARALPASSVPRLRGWPRWAAVAAAVAVVVGAALTWRAPAPPATPTLMISAQTYVEEFTKTPAPALEARVRVLEEEIADTRASLALADSLDLDISLAGLEEEFGDTLVDEPGNRVDALWQEWFGSM